MNMKRYILTLLFLLVLFALLVLVVLPISVPAQNQKITELSATTSPASDTLFVVVINPSTSPANRKLTVDNLFLSRTGNKNITAYASLSAAVTAISTTPAVIEIPATTTVSASLTIPANITLMPTGPGMVSVSASQTLTVNGPIEAPLRQIFTGAGSVRFGNRVDLSYPQWFGATMDGSTDDASAFQKAVDAFTGGGDTLRGGVVKLVGPIAIGSTILVTQSSITIEGTGWGAHTDSIKRGYLRWVGTTAIPMLLFRDCVRPGVKSLRIIGKSSGTKPSAAIQFDQTGGSGTLDQPFLEDIWIGSYYSSDTDTGIQFTTGILFTGSVNGDTGRYENVHIQNCVTGVDNQNGNASMTHWDTITIGSCTTGLKTVAPQHVITNYLAYLNDVDIELAASGIDMVVVNYYSEGSGRMLISSAGSPLRFVAIGGGFQADGTNKFTGTDETGKRWMINMGGLPSGSGLWLELRDFTLSTLGTPPTPLIRAYNTGGASTAVTLILEGVKGFTSNNFDVSTDAVASSSRTVVFNRQLGNSAIPPQFTRYIFDPNDSEDRAYQDLRFDIAGKSTIYGGPVKIKRLAAPNLAVTAVGGTGTTYSYKVSAVTRDGETLASSASTVSGGATLGGGVYNIISMNPVVGAYAYKIYGRTSGSELLLKTFTVADWADTFQAGWRDDGTITPSGALPLRNSTGNLTVAGIFSGGKGEDVVSAATIVPTGNVFHVTGTTSITSVSGTGITAGTEITIIFDGILTFTDGSNLKLNGNFVTSADDTITLIYDGTSWFEKSRSAN